MLVFRKKKNRFFLLKNPGIWLHCNPFREVYFSTPNIFQNNLQYNWYPKYYNFEKIWAYLCLTGFSQHPVLKIRVFCIVGDFSIQA